MPAIVAEPGATTAGTRDTAIPAPSVPAKVSAWTHRTVTPIGTSDQPVTMLALPATWPADIRARRPWGKQRPPGPPACDGDNKGPAATIHPKTSQAVSLDPTDVIM